MLDTAPTRAGTGLVPYGLTHQVRLRPAFTQAPPDLTYCPRRQQTLAGGRPLADQPELLRAYTVTWGTAKRDNKTDDGG